MVPNCSGRSEKLNMLWKAVSPQSPVSILLRKKFLKRRTFYLLKQTASFNPAIFVLSTSGNVNISPSPSHNQTRSATIKCLNCMKTVWSNCKRLLCEKCLSLTHAHCIDILPMELKHAVLLNRYVTIVPWGKIHEFCQNLSFKKPKEVWQVIYCILHPNPTPLRCNVNALNKHFPVTGTRTIGVDTLDTKEDPIDFINASQHEESDRKWHLYLKACYIPWGFTWAEASTIWLINWPWPNSGKV